MMGLILPPCTWHLCIVNSKYIYIEIISFYQEVEDLGWHFTATLHKYKSVQKSKVVANQDLYMLYTKLLHVHCANAIPKCGLWAWSYKCP